MRDYSSAIDEIARKGVVTAQIRLRYFSALNAEEIRDVLEGHHFSRHMPIEFQAVHVDLVKAFEILGVVSSHHSDNRFVFWDSEMPSRRAIREVLETTGIRLTRSDLEFTGVTRITQFSKETGDRSIFNVANYIGILNQSVGVAIAKKTIDNLVVKNIMVKDVMAVHSGVLVS